MCPNCDQTDSLVGFAPDNTLRAANDDDWWCWQSKEECLLDIMAGFPRSCFSEKELDATRWFARKNGITGLPTIKQVKNHRNVIANVAGVSPRLVDGTQGNYFAINDWLKIIKHVRMLLPTYFETSTE